MITWHLLSFVHIEAIADLINIYTRASVESSLNMP